MDRYDPYTDKFIRDTIDRTDAIDALCKNGLEKERSGQLVMAMCEAKQWAIDTIEQLPSAQPKKGKWIYHIDDLFPAESTMECNQCHAEQPLTCDDEFCPHCGAKMGDKDE